MLGLGRLIGAIHRLASKIDCVSDTLELANTTARQRLGLDDPSHGEETLILNGESRPALPHSGEASGEPTVGKHNGAGPRSRKANNR